jgi:hypothetical protein
MNNNETKHLITDLSFQLIDAVTDISKFPNENKVATVAIYRSGHYLYTITIKINDEKYNQYNHLEYLAESKNGNDNFVFKLKDEPDTIYTLRYLNDENDIHTFLIRPEYKKIDTAKLLDKQSLRDTVMKKLNILKMKILKRKNY